MKINKLILRAGWSFILLIPLMMGCGDSLPQAAAPDQARQALAKALDTWKKGEAVAPLSREEPPIYFKDLSCESGAKLVKYTIEDGHQPHGQSVMLTVKLTLQTKDGKTRERKMVYQIDTHPAVVIVPGTF